jgi:hypothetical protein
MAFEFRGAIIVSLLAKDKQRPACRGYIKALQAALVLESCRSAAAYIDCTFEEWQSSTNDDSAGKLGVLSWYKKLKLRLMANPSI